MPGGPQDDARPISGAGPAAGPAAGPVHDRSPGRFAAPPVRGTPSPAVPSPGADDPGPWPGGGGGPGSDGFRRRRADLPMSRLAPAAVLLLVGAPVALLVDDVAGPAYGVRENFPRAAGDVRGRDAVDPYPGTFLDALATVRTTPGATTVIRAPRYDGVRCEIRDGDEWTPLPSTDGGAGFTDYFPIWGVGSSGRRGGEGLFESYVRVHEFMAAEPRTTLRCGGPASRQHLIQVWHTEDTGPYLGYQATVYGVRGLWLLGFTAPIWLPIVRAFRRRHDPGATTGTPATGPAAPTD